MSAIKCGFTLKGVMAGMVVSFLFAVVTFPLYAAEPQPWDAVADEKAANREADFDDAMADTEEQGSAEGEVASVSSGSKTIAIKKDEYGTGQPTISMYYVNRDTTYEGVGSLSGISAGDTVSMDYFIYKDRNIADNIVLQKKSYSDDTDDSKSSVPKMLVD